MNTKVLLVTVAALALALVLLWPIQAPPPSRQPVNHDPALRPTPARPPTPAPESLSPEQQALLDNPKIKAFAQRLAFEEALQAFFATARSLPEAERRDRAADLRERMQKYEQSAQMSASEAAVLELAMIQILESDETTARAAAQELVDRYRAESEARLQAWLNEPRPDFERYKVREKAIVEEVMAMDQIPGGLTRNQYLRERLQQARIEAMGQSAGADQSN